MWSVEQKTCKNRSKLALKRPIFSHKWLILWLQKYLFINLSWHGGCGTLLSSFEDLEVPKTNKSSIFWPGLPKTPAPLYMCAVWRKSRSFTQGEFSHFPSSHFVQFICAQCGGSGEVGAPGWLSNDCQATQTTGFPGPFRIPSNFLPFFSSP